MLKVISNFQIENVIKRINDEDLSNNFVGVFPSNKMSRFIDYKQLINQKTGKYLFLISNTDDSTKNEEHWWSILDITQKKDLLFYAFGVEGLKDFIITDDKKTIQKILSGIEKMTQTDDKITFVKVEFSMSAWEKLSSKEIENLSDTDGVFFILYKILGIF